MTRFQLRRLALQATRRPELLPVLQDALLESAAYGADFENAIKEARLLTRGSVWPVVVAFNPRLRTPFAWFIGSLSRWRKDWTRRGYTPVYQVDPERRRQ